MFNISNFFNSLLAFAGVKITFMPSEKENKKEVISTNTSLTSEEKFKQELESLTKKQLMEFNKTRNLKLRMKMTKQQMINTIIANQ